MNDKFFDLKKEKQDRIINAALKLFDQYGYKRASTDEMVLDAGISKGLLFHYFGSKLHLYEFIYEYSARYVSMEYERDVELLERDFFEIQKQLEYAKWQIMKNYPYMLSFLNHAYLEEEEAAVQQIRPIMDMTSNTLQQIYARADLTRFREGIDPSKVLKMVIFTMDGLLREQVTLGKLDPKVLYEESVEYLEMFRKCYYTHERNEGTVNK